ncbi:hypothetical protein ABZ647_17730 [Micromonospora aurantiaca]|uniref:hypothetical protein n=1 Tax=Micromonospora aurantiaca (nom. illeg.) TaxID=47850 RepID=UPI00340920F7
MSGTMRTPRGQIIDFRKVHPSVLPAYGPYGPDLSNPTVAADVLHRSRLAFQRDRRVVPVRGIGPLIVKATVPGMTNAEGETLRALVAAGMPDDLNAADELVDRAERRNRVGALVASVYGSPEEMLRSGLRRKLDAARARSEERRRRRSFRPPQVMDPMTAMRLFGPEVR